MKKRWVHCFFPGSLGVPFQDQIDGKTTLCGKTAISIHGTQYKNDVTCPRCLEEMKKRFWFCEKHGFIADKEVTNNETCEHCGRDV